MEHFFSSLALSNDRYYRFGRHLLFWILCWLFMGFIYGFYYHSENRPHFLRSYLESLLYLPQHILLSYGIIYFILPAYIFKGKYWQAIMGVLILIVVVSCLSPIIYRFIIVPLRGSHAPIKYNTIVDSLMAGLRGSMTIAGFAVAIKLVKLWYQKKIDNDRLEKEKLKAELEILKGQLNPHFMFNTLNSIYALALKKSDYTPNAILMLSQLMRYILTECTAFTIELHKEIQAMNDYIALEKNRFGSRIDIALNIQTEFQNKMIAPLLLLPFIENSFKHGTSEMIEQAWISLDLQVKGDTLKFKLINGKMEERSQAHNSPQVGLLNVRRRLELLYPQAHTLILTEDKDTFVVSLTLELDNIKSPEV
jgi:sensor histidine kinase YesM